jgi:hypothetical protein
MPVYPDPDHNQHALNHELQQLADRLRHARPHLTGEEAMAIARTSSVGRDLLKRFGVDGGSNA